MRPVLVFKDCINSFSAPDNVSSTSTLKLSFKDWRLLKALSRSLRLFVVSLIIDSNLVNSASNTLLLNPIDNLASANESRKADRFFILEMVLNIPLLKASKLPDDND